MKFIDELEFVLRKNASDETAVPMQAYMKNLFPFLGIKNERRKALLKPIWLKHSDEIKSDFRQVTLELFKKPEREFQYCAMEILQKEIRRKFEKGDSVLIEKLIATKSWWDSVDFLAKHILGNYLLAFPDQTSNVISRFSDSENMWLNRSAILFQLGYKRQTDAVILFHECAKHAHTKEFFIGKAIGWALREYAKTDPDSVKDFVFKTELSPLSKREALKNL
ncbi:MAG: DNA alkylation repair protein [Flavobacterium sp.]|uniref:DNA alkylation repair protein n=1 Tax=Flavobacterium sp. TaxID=239 RepID=UPI0012240341|nr:DNA alkylation repair protein [Flavobacterium sp.]RZJ68219.1 MAG: DNA alkylation repair protein [Flavobacterium sp.]